VGLECAVGGALGKGGEGGSRGACVVASSFGCGSIDIVF